MIDMPRVLRDHLDETFATPEDVETWLHRPSIFLEGITPAEAIQAGRADRVEAALEALDSGIFI